MLPDYYKQAEGLLGISFLWGLIFLVFVCVEVFTLGSVAILSYGFQIFLYLVLFFSVPLLGMTAACISIWHSQEAHIEFLAEVEIFAQLLRERDDVLELVAKCKENITTFDKHPKIFGVDISPALLNALQGYLFAAICTVSAKFIYGD